MHGWGASLLTFNKLIDVLSNNYKVYAIDLPGFGQSEVGVPFSVEEVADLIYSFTLEMAISNPILLGHSYGGRVAIVYAAKYQVKKLVLVSAAGIRQKLRFSKKLKIKIYKMLKKCHLPIKMGSTDYQNADNVKRIMLVKAVNQDLSEFMVKIKSPTLLIYGVCDDVTPLKLAEQIKSKIKNSVLIKIEECGHFPYLERASYFSIILMSFLLGDSNDL